MSVTINNVKFTAEGAFTASGTTTSAGKYRVTFHVPRIKVENHASSARWAWCRVGTANGRISNWAYKKVKGDDATSMGALTTTYTFDKTDEVQSRTYYVMVTATTSSSVPSGNGTELEGVNITIPALSSVTITYKLTIDGTDEVIKTETHTEASTAYFAEPAVCDYFDDDAVLRERFNWWYLSGAADSKYMPNGSYTVPSANRSYYANISPPMCVKVEDRGWLLGCPYVRHNGSWIKLTDIKGKLGGEWLDVRKDIISL